MCNHQTVISLQTLDMDPMLDQCWASIVDDGLTLSQHWIYV